MKNLIFACLGLIITTSVASGCYIAKNSGNLRENIIKTKLESDAFCTENSELNNSLSNDTAINKRRKLTTNCTRKQKKAKSFPKNAINKCFVENDDYNFDDFDNSDNFVTETISMILLEGELSPEDLTNITDDAYLGEYNFDDLVTEAISTALLGEGLSPENLTNITDDMYSGERFLVNFSDSSATQFIKGDTKKKPAQAVVIKEVNVDPDGNCGYTALGVTREEAYNDIMKMMKEPSDPRYDIFIKKLETFIKHWFYFDDMKSQESPEERQKLKNQFFPNIKDMSLLIESNPSKDPLDPKNFTPENVSEFLTCIVKGRLWLEAGGDNSLASIIAFIKGKRLIIISKNGSFIQIMGDTSKTSLDDTLWLIFNGVDHFTRGVLEK